MLFTSHVASEPPPSPCPTSSMLSFASESLRLGLRLLHSNPPLYWGRRHAVHARIVRMTLPFGHRVVPFAFLFDTRSLLIHGMACQATAASPSVRKGVTRSSGRSCIRERYLAFSVLRASSCHLFPCGRLVEHLS